MVRGVISISMKKLVKTSTTGDKFCSEQSRVKFLFITSSWDKTSSGPQTQNGMRGPSSTW